MTPILVPVLGDQLSANLASLRDCDPAHAIVLMMEVWEEATHVRHHGLRRPCRRANEKFFTGWRVASRTTILQRSLGISATTVATYIQRVFTKLYASDRVTAVVIAANGA